MSTTPTSPNLEDLLFTDVDFLSVEDGKATQTTAQTGNQPAAPVTQTPQVTAPAVNDEPFLKGKASIYKTREDATKSLDEKDDKIEYLRNFAIQHTGVDPFKSNAAPVKTGPQAAPVTDESYVSNPKKYVEDLAKAWESGDPSAYAKVQQKLIQENMNQVLAPYLPTIQQSIRGSAIDATAKQVKDFTPAFFDTPEYKAVLEENKILANAIDNAEKYIDFKDQLPELYRIAHAMAQNKKVPDLLKAAQSVAQTQAAPTSSTTQVRPTASSSTMNPPTPVSSTNWKTDPEARKAYIERMRNGGAESLPLSITRPAV